MEEEYEDFDHEYLLEQQIREEEEGSNATASPPEKEQTDDVDHLIGEDETNQPQTSQSTPPDDSGEAVAIDATAQAAKEAHEASLAAHKTAQEGVKAALKAKADAAQERADALTAKEAARGGVSESSMTGAWKAAVEKFKTAESHCRKAREEAKEADKARKQAWEHLSKARAEVAERDKATRDAAARDFHSSRHTLICAPRQASEGLKPWDGCPGVTRVRLESAKLLPLDGHTEMAVDGTQVRFEPILGGATVLVSGTGGMKTVRTLEWLLRASVEQLAQLGKINAELPFVFVTARINLAHKLDADLQKRGIDVHNYKSCPKGTSMEEWIKHPHVIISVEQVEKLESWIATYQNGIVVIDECVTAASSIVNGVTVHQPVRTARTLRKLVDASSYLILMDADFDSDGKGRTLLQGIAPKKPVLFVQTIAPSLQTTIFYGYDGIKEEEVIFLERRELSCRTSAAERRDGVSPDGNRTYIGVDWPSDAIRNVQKLREWGVKARGLHGKLGSKIRKDALKDLDAYVGPVDAFVTTSVAGIGTDQNCKYKAGFIDLRSGDHAPGPRQAAQKIGRLNRNRDNPLDPFTDPGGKLYPGGAVFVLLPGFPPKFNHAEASRFDPQDRAERKLYSMRKQVDSKNSAVLSTQAQAERLCDRRDSVHVQYDGGLTRLSQSATCTEDPDIAATLAKLEALDLVEGDDKQPHSYATKYFEMMALPSRSFQHERIMKLSESERQELERLREAQNNADMAAPTADEAVGEMDANDQYFFIKERVEADGDGGLFWKDNYSKCVAGQARFEGDNIDEAYATVWDTLHSYKVFPPDEDPEGTFSSRIVQAEPDDDEPEVPGFPGCKAVPKQVSKDYMDLYRDSSKHNILHRGMMRFLSMEELQLDEVRGCRNGFLSDPTVGSLRPAYKLPLLQQLAHVLRLSGVVDLLEPRSFSPSTHEWPRAHNRLVEGGDGAEEEDKSMARAARSFAIKLGCTGIRHGEKVKKPTTLLATVHAVLTQCCAMRPPELKKNDARSVMGEWNVEEMAPGYAELGLHWHDGLQDKVPLGEYAERDAKWRAHEAEAEEQRRSSDALAATNAMFSSFDYDFMETDAVADGSSPGMQYIEPCNPNVLYVHYEEAALKKCLDAWGADETPRKAATATLFDLGAALKAQSGIKDDDPRLMQLRAWQRALRRLETRHRIAITLRDSLPQAAKDGPLKGALVAREEYEYKADGEGRRWAKGEGWRDDDGEWRSATSQGMPSDLRTLLMGWKYDDADGRKSDPTIYVILACKLGMPRSYVAVLIDEYLISDEVCDKWHSDVAAHHGVSLVTAKRWPNIFGNGGGYRTCLEKAELPLDMQPDPRVQRMERTLHRLRVAIAKASRDRPGALWPGSEHFWNRHDARLQREMPHLKEHERFNKVFSYLIGTAEDKILSIHMEAQRSARRDAIGSAKFDAMPAEQRDTGCLAFDGLNTERVGDPEAGNEAAEAALVRAGWHAQFWGIEYKIVTKPMFGKQHMSPDDFDTAKDARRALQEAAAAYLEVGEAVANPSARRSHPLPVAGGNASVIPVHNGRALLTIEVRDRKRGYGLFGGKAETGETLAVTAAREAYEETGRILSDASRAAIESFDLAAFKECRAAAMHVAVVPIGGEDDNAPSLFDKAKANRPGSKTEHVGVAWVDINKLLDHRWRTGTGSMHYHHRLMVDAVRSALSDQKTPAGGRLTGEKRSRDEPSDDELIAALDAAEAGATAAAAAAADGSESEYEDPSDVVSGSEEED
jgi:8-oxo-dGTP pyrophosphatase MutT (NUDIX family)